ncbi:MAG: hypothetical protein IH991_01145 [Planctomycetes bacterium]|nr:hypothetical protein [Planctomycetota bacterium]
MHKPFLTLGVMAISLGIGGSLFACGPGDFNSFAARSAKGFNPAYASGQFGPQQLFAQQAQIAQHRQMLAMQAAARRARRKPMQIAKAMKMREEMLAKREANRIRVAKMYQDYKQRKAMEAATDPVMLANTMPTPRY